MDAKIKRLLELSGMEVPDETPAGEESPNPEDVVSVDVPLLIRIMEWAREDAKTDMQLHKVAENLVELSSEEGKTLCMKDYDAVIAGTEEEGLNPPKSTEQQPEQDQDIEKM